MRYLPDEIVPSPPNYWPLEPTDMTLFGNSLCRCSQVNMMSYEIRVCFNPGMSALMKMREFGHRNIQREDGHVIMRAEIGVKQLQAKELQGFAAALRSWSKAWKGFPLRAYRWSMAWLTPWFQTAVLQNSIKVNFCCFNLHIFYGTF